MGVPATGVSLTPPASCPGGSTVYCDQVIGGSSPTQPFELSNNTANAINGITASFSAGNTADFTIASSSCAASLAASASCDFNVAFAPTANATTACTAGSASNTRCATFSVNYNGATAPLTTLVSGVADDFQLDCMTTSTFTCPPPSNGAPYQITIAQGQAATFQLQVVPDDTFSGTVTLVCPTGLPAGPTGTTGQPDDLRPGCGNLGNYAAGEYPGLTSDRWHRSAVHPHVSDDHNRRNPNPADTLDVCGAASWTRDCALAFEP